MKGFMVFSYDFYRLDIPETTISTIENFGDVVAGNRKK